MSSISDQLSVERHQDVWTVRFQPLDSMMFERSEITESIFQLLADVESNRVKVLRAVYPDGSLSPAMVDQFWEKARQAPLIPGARGEPPLPSVVRNVNTAIPRLLRYVRRINTFCIASFQGEIDLDLFGVTLVAQYRVCTDDTVVVNRVLDREAGPGSAIFWLLTQYLGYATASHLLMDGKSLTAQEALDLRLVNRVVSAADLESESRSLAEHFATKSTNALASLVRASRYLDEDLPSYLEHVGSGFSG